MLFMTIFVVRTCFAPKAFPSIPKTTNFMHGSANVWHLENFVEHAVNYMH